MKPPIDVTQIPEKDKNSTVLLLLDITREQAEIIQQLRDEIARLKNQPSRPKIRPSQLENKGTGKKETKGQKTSWV
jgi:hypothetical protein